MCAIPTANGSHKKNRWYLYKIKSSTFLLKILRSNKKIKKRFVIFLHRVFPVPGVYSPRQVVLVVRVTGLARPNIRWKSWFLKFNYAIGAYVVPALEAPSCKRETFSKNKTAAATAPVRKNERSRHYWKISNIIILSLVFLFNGALVSLFRATRYLWVRRVVLQEIREHWLMLAVQCRVLHVHIGSVLEHVPNKRVAKIA